jgi:hypothetical protein
MDQPLFGGGNRPRRRRGGNAKLSLGGYDRRNQAANARRAVLSIAGNKQEPTRACSRGSRRDRVNHSLSPGWWRTNFRITRSDTAKLAACGGLSSGQKCRFGSRGGLFGGDFGLNPHISNCPRHERLRARGRPNSHCGRPFTRTGEPTTSNQGRLGWALAYRGNRNEASP